MRVVIFLQLILARAEINPGVNLAAEDCVLHILRSEGRANRGRVYVLAAHRLFHLRDGLEALRGHHPEHLAVDFRLDIFGQIQFLPLLHENQLINETGNYLRLATGDFFRCFLLRDTLLLKRVYGIFHLALEGGEHHHITVDLRDHGINDDRLALLRRRCRRARDQKQNGGGYRLSRRT